MTVFSSARPLRAAVIGSGPSGIYAADALLKQLQVPVEVDVFDRLPTPYGLVRYGVAPDHLKIKSVTTLFQKVLGDPRVRFLGNVEVGQNLSVGELRAHYDAVIYTVGASSDRRLNIPGEDLGGSLSATEFVAWYNGHPDAAAREMLLHASGVAVVGAGNVALDVARILAKTMAELHTSDIAAHALTALEHSEVEDVYLLSRRGPLQAKFTTKELREFGELAGADVVVRPEEIAVSDEDYAAISDNVVKRNVDVLREFALRAAQGQPRRVHLRFLVSPVELISDAQGQVAGVRIEKNHLDAQGNAVGSGQFEVLPVQMVLRSVGYKGVALSGVPFDDKRGVIPNTRGRIEGRSGEYTAGWIKRGPSGVIGTNKADAAETVATLLEDVPDLTPAPEAGRAAVDALLASRQVDVVSLEDYLRLDAHELSSGQAAGRPRLKVAHREAMFEVIRAKR
ncbi:FAD-dependent oxidoreductase [Deinococcus rubellus]|uniref:FAD-dependent oxidoreductase n=1 Tax=Deinococcus rubellus TaxID=1889240 RepID=A0ABY5YD59_9DEIO|nr:FAD-dependent oxidoreductase [Deinococcus rubellus]UWX63005.1 FAD-dependent oxidoreductase [Deinococcus rubellus]